MSYGSTAARWLVRLTAPALLSLLAAVPAHAQGGAGIRGGVSVDPDQFYFGGHANVGPVVGSLWFRPNVEVGVGKDVKLLALNPELAYWLGKRTAWRAYLGGGPALNIYFNNGSETRAGLNFLLGVAHRGGFFAEVKVGAFDSPNAKLGAGFTFR